jgi:ADP-ribose pyrophosphatase
MSDELVRISLNRGDSAAVVMVDPAAGTVILTEQFRYPTYGRTSGWILEIPAGTVEDDEAHDPAQTLRREVMEEIGYTVRQVRHVYTFYVSPGGTSERILLYYAQVSPKDQTSRGGGLISEGEDIRILRLPVDAALSKLTAGEITDAKTIIGLQWLALNRSQL